MQRNNTLILIVLYGFIVFSSCSVSKYRYLNVEKDDIDIKDTLMCTPPEYRIQTNDLLYVHFYSILEESVSVFNKQKSTTSLNQNMGQQNSNNDWIGYRVNNDGRIELPVIGEIMVKGLTLDQVKRIADSSINVFVQDAFAEVKLLSFDVDMLGEFNNPGQINVKGNRLNLMEAIDKAGGLSYTGNWRKVYIIRHVEDMKYSFYIDVTNKELLGVENYYLMPHDVVYVEPRPMGAAKINISDFTLLLSVISTSITTVLLILSFK